LWGSMMLRAATINRSTSELQTGSESLIAEWEKPLNRGYE
jgi:hypothetical protein